MFFGKHTVSVWLLLVTYMKMYRSTTFQANVVKNMDCQAMDVLKRQIPIIMVAFLEKDGTKSMNLQ